MPRMGTSKESLEGKPALPPGVYEFRLDGFKPKTAKKGDSTNLNPQLKVINHPTQNDNNIFLNLNSGAGWIMKDFVHSLGHQMEIVGDDAWIPGEFRPDPQSPDDISKSVYEGPLLGATGKCEVAQKFVDGKNLSHIKMFYCKVPNCQEKHSTDLK